MPDAPANTDPTGTQTSWFSAAVGNVAGWINHVVSGTPTPGQLQATSASLDNQLANGTNAKTLAATIAGDTPQTVSGPTTGPASYVGNDTYYAPGGDGYDQMAAIYGTAAADYQYQQVLADGQYSTAQTNAIPSQVGDAAIAGAKNAATNLVNDAKNLPGKLFLGIGWQWWLVGAVVLFVYLDGMDYLRRKLKSA